MAYRFNGADPQLYAAIGAFNGFTRNAPFSYAALLKRNAVSAWHSIYNIENGAFGNFMYPMEFEPGDRLAGDFTTANPFMSVATFNDIVNWMIVGATWDGSTNANKIVWRWKIGGGAWNSELDTSPGSNATAAGSGYHHLIGTEGAGGDDANYDMCCIGAIKSELNQATFESLDMSSFASWKGVFTGANAWLMGFDTISLQLDRTGNGGDEGSRSGGITLVADPPGWLWSAPGVTNIDYKQFPKPRLRSTNGIYL